MRIFIKRLLFALIITCCSFSGYSQENKITIDTIVLKSEAEKMALALLSEQYETFTSYTYPRLVELSGGSEAFIKNLKSSVDKMKAEGFSFKTFSIGSVGQSIKAGNEIHVIVAQHIVMLVPGGTLAADSHLIAILKDGKSNWTFIDANNLNAEKIALVLPNFNRELKIPEKQQPVFKED